MAFERSLKAVQIALNKNVRHARKHWAISDINPQAIILHAHEELGELSDSLEREGGPDPYELCDAMAVLFHFMLKYGWSEDEIDKAIVEKLLVRFEFDDETKKELEKLSE